MPKYDKQLANIRDLAQSGKRQQALAQLARLIEKDHDNAELWWYLANITNDPHQARRALDQMESLTPNDPRISKLRNKLETRVLLKEMGVASEKPVNRQGRVLFFMLTAAVTALVVIGIVAAALLRQSEADAIANVPTQVVLPTLPPTEVPTEVPTATAEPTAVMPEPTAVSPVSLAPEATEEAVSQTETDDITQVAMLVPTAEVTPQITVDVPPPSDTGILPPPDPVAGQNPAGDLNNPAQAISPEATQEIVPLPEATQDISGAGGFIVTPTATPRVVLSNAINQGQIVMGEPRRVLIAPYGEHTYTFSGYRDEQITLELTNLSAGGNASLQLTGPTGDLVAEDLDLTSGSSRDARLEVRLPGDGIYTVIVRMVAVNEQLYALTLTRQ